MFGSRASLSAPHRWDVPHAKDPLLTSFRFVLSAASAMFTLYKRKKKQKTNDLDYSPSPHSPCNNVMISFTLKDQKDLPSCCQSHRAHALFYFFSPPLTLYFCWKCDSNPPRLLVKMKKRCQKAQTGWQAAKVPAEWNVVCHGSLEDKMWTLHTASLPRQWTEREHNRIKLANQSLIIIPCLDCTWGMWGFKLLF